MKLRYGVNPDQAPASAHADGGELPFRVLNGAPSYINLLDALHAWPMVKELRQRTGLHAAASFKHMAPAGASVGAGGGEPLSLADTYLRARACDPRSSYGDFVSLSHQVDVDTASLLKGLVCDGVVAPGYTDEALAVLRSKKGGSFLVLDVDAEYEPPAVERRQVFGVTLEQPRPPTPISEDDLGVVATGRLEARTRGDVLFGLTVLRYTPSNSVAFVRDGQTVGIGAGQQSRIDCSKLAGAKADRWTLVQHPTVQAMTFTDGTKVQHQINWRYRVAEGGLSDDERRQLGETLTSDPAVDLSDEERRAWLAQGSGAAFVSDGFLPFADNLDEIARHGADVVAAPAGSVRDDDIVAAASRLSLSLVFTMRRYFHH